MDEKNTYSPENENKLILARTSNLKLIFDTTQPSVTPAHMKSCVNKQKEAST